MEGSNGPCASVGRQTCHTFSSSWQCPCVQQTSASVRSGTNPWRRRGAQLTARLRAR